MGGGQMLHCIPFEYPDILTDDKEGKNIDKSVHLELDFVMAL